MADVVLFALVGSLYVGAAKLGLALSVAHGVITPVWAPTGIALASLILFGRRLWPAILVAAFIANATSDASIPVAVVIAVGNTLEAVVGSALLARARFRPALDRVRDVLALVLLGAVASTAVSATTGVTALWIAHDLANSYGFSWLLWWTGDAMGNIVVAPFLLVLLAAPVRSIVPPPRRPEAAALLALTAGLSAFVFLAGYWRYPHLLFPLFVWATVRFRQVGAVTSSVVVTAVAIAGAVSGNTPLTAEDPTQVVLILEGLLAGIAISVLILGAALAERSDAEDRLAEAQEVAHVGSWSWDVDADRVTWSAELYRLNEVPDGSPMTYASFLNTIHPDDRELMRRAVERALADAEPFALDYRCVTEDGGVRWLHGRARVVLDTRGRPVRILGTAQDITEQRRLDELRDTILSAVSHELRTPLTAIVGFAQTLKERTLEPTLRTAVIESLFVQAQRLERLLADLLDLDRLRRGFVRPKFAETDIASLAQFTALHGGRAWVQENPGGGASFRVFLPSNGSSPESPVTVERAP